VKIAKLSSASVDAPLWNPDYIYVLAILQIPRVPLRGWSGSPHMRLLTMSIPTTQRAGSRGNHYHDECFSRTSSYSSGSSICWGFWSSIPSSMRVHIWCSPVHYSTSKISPPDPFHSPVVWVDRPFSMFCCRIDDGNLGASMTHCSNEEKRTR
jgi:hypothetical protein